MRIFAAATLFAAMLAPLPAAAQQWYRINVSALGVQYVDLDSIVPDGAVLRGSEFTVLRMKLGNGDFKYIATVMQYDCKGRSVRLLTMEGFDAKNVSSGPFADAEEDAFGPVEPGSPGAVALDFVCGTDRSKGVAVTDPRKDKF